MEAIGQLAGGVAHDFNNILTAILGNVELSMNALKRHVPQAHGVLEGIREIENGAQRAATLTRQLLVFSRRQLIKPAILDLTSTVAEL
jgi:signal transduction histidine kinase